MVKLKELLHQETTVEEQQRLNNGININYMGLKYGPNSIPKMPKDPFFSNFYINATKQNRYSYMPAHTHNFIEFNYQFSGKSDQILNGVKYTLTKNQLLIMDRDLIQKYGYMGENDLLVNILLNVDRLPSNLITDIHFAKEFSRFLYNAETQASNHENYLIYDLSDYPYVQAIWKQLMLYSLTGTKPFETQGFLLQAVLSCLPTPKVSVIHILQGTSNSIPRVVDYIDRNFDTITLEKLSHHFGYNKNYLGNKIKSYTGLSFGELLDRKRLLMGESFLLDTTLSINDVSEKLGYKNPSSLFRLFDTKLNMTPNQFRINHPNELN